MNDAQKPIVDSCSSCFHYHVTPQNLKQGECRRYPPSVYPIPQPAQMPGQANYIAMNMPLVVNGDYVCGEYESREPENETG